MECYRANVLALFSETQLECYRANLLNFENKMKIFKIKQIPKWVYLKQLPFSKRSHFHTHKHTYILGRERDYLDLGFGVGNGFEISEEMQSMESVAVVGGGKGALFSSLTGTSNCFCIENAILTCFLGLSGVTGRPLSRDLNAIKMDMGEPFPLVADLCKGNLGMKK